jgi:hypothetical protein
MWQRGGEFRRIVESADTAKWRAQFELCTSVTLVTSEPSFTILGATLREDRKLL